MAGETAKRYCPNRTGICAADAMMARGHTDAGIKNEPSRPPLPWPQLSRTREAGQYFFRHKNNFLIQERYIGAEWTQEKAG
jgi:hypothetical protein